MQGHLDGEGGANESPTLKKIQEILYSTEVSVELTPSSDVVDINDLFVLQEGFEVPDANVAPVDEEETF